MLSLAFFPFLLPSIALPHIVHALISFPHTAFILGLVCANFFHIIPSQINSGLWKRILLFQEKTFDVKFFCVNEAKMPARSFCSGRASSLHLHSESFIQNMSFKTIFPSTKLHCLKTDGNTRRCRLVGENIYSIT